MSVGFMIYSTVEITWEDFYKYLLNSMRQFGAEEMSSDHESQVWIKQKDLEVEFSFGLIHKNDIAASEIQQAVDDLQIPFEIGIAVGVYYHRLEDVNRLTLEILCLLAKKWPIVVNDGGFADLPTYYTNDDLFQLLKEGKGFFR